MYSGKGRPRSYAFAALLASLAAAAGDAEAADILEDVDRRVQMGGEEAMQAWASVEQEIVDEALAVWVEFDLAKKFGK